MLHKNIFSSTLVSESYRRHSGMVCMIHRARNGGRSWLRKSGGSLRLPV